MSIRAFQTFTETPINGPSTLGFGIMHQNYSDMFRVPEAVMLNIKHVF